MYYPVCNHISLIVLNISLQLFCLNQDPKSSQYSWFYVSFNYITLQQFSLSLPSYHKLVAETWWFALWNVPHPVVVCLLPCGHHLTCSSFYFLKWKLALDWRIYQVQLFFGKHMCSGPIFSVTKIDLSSEGDSLLPPLSSPPSTFYLLSKLFPESVH